LSPQTPVIAAIVLAATASATTACAPNVTEVSHASSARSTSAPTTEVRASTPAPPPTAHADAPRPTVPTVARVTSVDAAEEAATREAVGRADESLRRLRRRGSAAMVARGEAELLVAVVELASVLCRGVEPRLDLAEQIREATEAVNEAQELVDGDPARGCRREGGDEADCEIVAASYDQELTNAEERLAALERELDLAGLVAACAPSDPDVVRGLRGPPRVDALSR
jgi:hypothetical protein